MPIEAPLGITKTGKVYLFRIFLSVALTSTKRYNFAGKSPFFK
jgi:hypothetical protein